MINLLSKTMCGSFLFLFGFAHAVTLTPNAFTSLPGTTVSADPTLAGPILVDTLQPFSFTDSASGGLVTGEVQIRVVRSNTDHTLDFYWRVFNDANSSAPIGDLRLGDFFSPEYNANYRTDGSGDIGPDGAYLFAPPNGFLNFNFFEGLNPGQSSYFMFLDTTATSYAQTAFYDVTTLNEQSNSSLGAMYAPVIAGSTIPEPSTLLLLGFGLAGIAGIKRRLINT